MSFAGGKCSVECRDLKKKPLSLGEVEHILSWIPESSLIHLVML